MNRKDHHHLNLVCNVSELAALLAGSENIENFLQRTVEMVARHMNANVCALYLLDEKSNELILKATVGFNPEAVGKTRLKIGEGSVGVTLKNLKPVKEGLASRHPRFKYLSEAGKDSFDSFLTVPVQRGAEKIGVLVVQQQEQDYFDEIDVMAMRAISSQLAGAIGNARLLIEQYQQRAQEIFNYQISPRLRMIEGQVASPGYAFAPATLFDKSHGALVSVEIDTETKYSLSDFHQAVQSTADQLNELQHRFGQRLPESAALIFTAHLMILKDLRFAGEMEKLVESGVSPSVAIKKVAEHYVELYSSSTHAHIREKAHDVQDLAGRIFRNLEHHVEEDPFLSENRIVIAPELYPSDVLKLACEDIKGIILVSGGLTAHVCILARSLQIPMIIATEPDLLLLPEGTPIIVDAENGSIYIEPSDELIDEFESSKQVKLESELSADPLSPFTLTKDGIRIRLLANINLLNDLGLARKFKAEGVGLYRTEFPFLIRSALPSEEEQYLIYKRLFDEYIPFLLGIGIRILSVYPKFLPSVQKTINGFTIDDVNLYASRLLSETTLKGVRNILKSFNKDAYLR